MCWKSHSRPFSADFRRVMVCYHTRMPQKISMSGHWTLNSLTQIRGKHPPPHSDCDFLSPIHDHGTNANVRLLFSRLFFNLSFKYGMKVRNLTWRGGRFLKPRMERKYRSKPTRLRGAGRTFLKNVVLNKWFGALFFIMLLIFNNMSTGVFLL